METSRVTTILWLCGRVTTEPMVVSIPVSVGYSIVSHSQTAFSSFIFGLSSRPNIKEEKAVWLRETRYTIYGHIALYFEEAMYYSTDM